MEEKKAKKPSIDKAVKLISQVKQWFKGKSSFKKALIIIAGIGCLFAIYIISVLVRYSGSSITGKTNTEEQEVVSNEDLGKNRFESFFLQKNGLVCFGGNRFSFQIDSPYKILSDDNNGIALYADGRLVTVSANDSNIVETLKNLGIAYQKNGDVYFYKVPAGKNYGMSQEKSGSMVSVFSSRANDEDSMKMLSNIALSLKEGCKENE